MRGGGGKLRRGIGASRLVTHTLILHSLSQTLKPIVQLSPTADAGDPCIRNILRVVLIEYDACHSLCISSLLLISCSASDSDHILTTTFFPSAIHTATLPP